jgi:hypothetical protein
VQLWDAENHRPTNSLEQHSWQLSSQCPHLFDYYRPRRNTFTRTGAQRLTSHRVADPAMRRAALWLVMQSFGFRQHHVLVMHCDLLFSAQDEFFGNRPHDGWTWLTNQAQAWPAAYRAHYWEGFETASDSFLKVQMTSMKVRNDKFEGCRHLPCAFPWLIFCDCESRNILAAEQKGWAR